MTHAARPLELAPAPALDWDTLDANTMGDPALQRELFDLYFGHALQAMERMRHALEAADAVNWAAIAHGLKGTARTLGLLRLAEVSAEAEAAGHRGPAAISRAGLDQIGAELTRATAAAHAYLAQIAAQERRV